MFIEELRRRRLLHGRRTGKVRSAEGYERRRDGELLRRFQESRHRLVETQRAADAHRRRKRQRRSRGRRTRSRREIKVARKKCNSRYISERRSRFLQRHASGGLQLQRVARCLAENGS